MKNDLDYKQLNNLTPTEQLDEVLKYILKKGFSVEKHLVHDFEKKWSYVPLY